MEHGPSAAQEQVSGMWQKGLDRLVRSADCSFIS